jgi:hypothetical protein
MADGNDEDEARSQAFDETWDDVLEAYSRRDRGQSYSRDLLGMSAPGVITINGVKASDGGSETPEDRAAENQSGSRESTSDGSGKIVFNRGNASRIYSTPNTTGRPRDEDNLRERDAGTQSSRLPSASPPVDGQMPNRSVRRPDGNSNGPNIDSGTRPPDNDVHLSCSRQDRRRDDRSQGSVVSERTAGRRQLLDFTKGADIFRVNNSSPSSNEERGDGRNSGHNVNIDHMRNFGNTTTGNRSRGIVPPHSPCNRDLPGSVQVFPYEQSDEEHFWQRDRPPMVDPEENGDFWKTRQGIRFGSLLDDQAEFQQRERLALQREQKRLSHLLILRNR